MKEKVEIKQSVLKEQVESGMKRLELAKFYGISENQIKVVLKAAGLRIRKFHAPTYVLINDLDDQVNNTIFDSTEE